MIKHTIDTVTYAKGKKHNNYVFGLISSGSCLGFNFSGSVSVKEY